MPTETFPRSVLMPALQSCQVQEISARISARINQLPSFVSVICTDSNRDVWIDGIYDIYYNMYEGIITQYHILRRYIIINNNIIWYYHMILY